MNMTTLTGCLAVVKEDYALIDVGCQDDNSEQIYCVFGLPEFHSNKDLYNKKDLTKYLREGDQVRFAPAYGVLSNLCKAKFVDLVLSVPDVISGVRHGIVEKLDFANHICDIWSPPTAEQLRINPSINQTFYFKSAEALNLFVSESKINVGSRVLFRNADSFSPYATDLVLAETVFEQLVDIPHQFYYFPSSSNISLQFPGISVTLRRVGYTKPYVDLDDFLAEGEPKNLEQMLNTDAYRQAMQLRVAELSATFDYTSDVHWNTPRLIRIGVEFSFFSPPLVPPKLVDVAPAAVAASANVPVRHFAIWSASDGYLNPNDGASAAGYSRSFDQRNEPSHFAPVNHLAGRQQGGATFADDEVSNAVAEIASSVNEDVNHNINDSVSSFIPDRLPTLPVRDFGVNDTFAEGLVSNGTSVRKVGRGRGRLLVLGHAGSASTEPIGGALQRLNISANSHDEEAAAREEAKVFPENGFHGSSNVLSPKGSADTSYRARIMEFEDPQRFLVQFVEEVPAHWGLEPASRIACTLANFASISSSDQSVAQDDFDEFKEMLADVNFVVNVAIDLTVPADVFPVSLYDIDSGEMLEYGIQKTGIGLISTLYRSWGHVYCKRINQLYFHKHTLFEGATVDDLGAVFCHLQTVEFQAKRCYQENRTPRYDYRIVSMHATDKVYPHWSEIRLEALTITNITGERNSQRAYGFSSLLGYAIYLNWQACPLKIEDLNEVLAVNDTVKVLLVRNICKMPAKDVTFKPLCFVRSNVNIDDLTSAPITVESYHRNFEWIPQTRNPRWRQPNRPYASQKPSSLFAVKSAQKQS